MIVEYRDNSYFFGITRTYVDESFYCYHSPGTVFGNVKLNQDGSVFIGPNGFCEIDPVRDIANQAQIESDNIAAKKKELIARIEVKTEELENQGVLFGGKMVPTGHETRDNLGQIRTMMPLPSYNFKILATDKTAVQITTELEFDDLCTAVLGFVMPIEQAGIEQILIVNAMTTMAELNAYIDPR